MKKLSVFALLALSVLISAPLAAVEAPAEPAEAPAVATNATPAVGSGAELPGALPVQPIKLYTCAQLCFTEYTSCKLDCRFWPYPGCANDCYAEYQSCLAGC